MVINKIAKQIIFVVILAAILRFYQLGFNPPGLYWEEAALGYDAYSILTTGKDFHGHPWPLAAFESFGDYKPSLYFYTAVPSVAAFGLTPLAVRFPSALFGTLTVLLVYFLVKPRPVGFAAALLLAISPWHLQLSRAGFEANLGLFLVVLGWWWSPALALSMYAYHANRLLAPLLFIVFAAGGRIKKVWANGLVFLVIALPLLLQLNSPVIRQRLAETSALTSLEPIIKSNELIAADGSTRWAKLLHHRFWQYKDIIANHYLDHFDFDFLFLKGDANPRHSIQVVGGLFLIQLPLIIFGLRRHWPLITWLLLAPIPAAITLATPHALRSLAMVIPLTIFSAYGLVKLKRFMWVIGVILAVELGHYLVSYYREYPINYSNQWQYGYEQMVGVVKVREDQYEQIFITRELGRPSIYYWFYTRTDPRSVQAVNNQVLRDQGEYLEFGKIKFGAAPQPWPQNSLVVLGPSEPLPETGTLIEEIYDLSGNLAFRIYET
ncbi:MAG: glycosyltransferase family 39 protein [Patescibacteria group bacterium]|nr:glycosyltransferase family 39 protein [Patescibacteria group bacterium]